jgi:hypothetical protein
VYFSVSAPVAAFFHASSSRCARRVRERTANLSVLWPTARDGEFLSKESNSKTGIKVKRQRIVLMRLKCFAALMLVATASSAAFAHGPQIQVTLDGGKIVTRELLLDGDYSTSLTNPKSVYVMPLGVTSNVWYSRPNGSLLPGGLPEFNSGPGLAYGYGYDATTNPAPFPVGSQFELTFTAGLKSWNGSAFVDAGVSQLEAFRGSGVNLVVARTSDAGPFQGIAFPSTISPSTGISFTASEEETHTSVSYRMLGDGASTTSALADGIYLASFQLGNTASSVQDSDPYYFVLSKNAAVADVVAATNSLGASAGQVQYLLVPEPTAAVLARCGALALVGIRRRHCGGL